MLLWILFIAVVLLFLALDLGVFHKNAEIISNKDAARWTFIWVAVSLCFSGVIYLIYASGSVLNPENYSPTTAVLKYITGYLVELSLSAEPPTPHFVLGHPWRHRVSRTAHFFRHPIGSSVSLDHLCVWGISTVYCPKNANQKRRRAF